MHGAKLIGTIVCLIILGHLLRVFLQSNLRYEIAQRRLKVQSAVLKIMKVA
tara:strand:+ start:334 stop:486 length:153 start_codon:yes stop_codon:yes gene_type:complete